MKSISCFLILSLFLYANAFGAPTKVACKYGSFQFEPNSGGLIELAIPGDLGRLAVSPEEIRACWENSGGGACDVFDRKKQCKAAKLKDNGKTVSQRFECIGSKGSCSICYRESHFSVEFKYDRYTHLATWNGTWTLSSGGVKAVDREIYDCAPLKYYELRNGNSSCGLEGSIQGRIKDCDVALHSSPKLKWSLVMYRNREIGKPIVLWMDTGTKLVWGNVLESRDWTYTNSVQLDENGTITEELACNSAEGKEANGNFSGESFRLPTLAEFEEVDSHIRNEYDGRAFFLSSHWPVLERRYWTATLNPENNAEAYATYPSHLSTASEPFHFPNAVRCVAKVK